MLHQSSQSYDLTIYGSHSTSNAQDLDPAVKATLSKRCFNGLGFLTCKALNLNDDPMHDLQYYQDFNKLLGTGYCLECCGQGRTIDVWDLGCTVDVYTAVDSNLYGYNMIFPSFLSYGSNGFISCPIKRSACKYNSTTGNVVSCDTANDKMHLHGYILTLEVIQNHDNFNFFNGIKSCSVQTIENNISLKAGDLFYEKIIMIHDDQNYTLDTSQLILLSILAVLSIYVILYFFRRKHCVVCCKKLIFCCHRCYLCRFYGAAPPDPLLLKALEEKGVYIQGDPPEKIPGAKFITKQLRKKVFRKVYPDIESKEEIGNGLKSDVGHKKRRVNFKLKEEFQPNRLDYRLNVHPYVVHVALRHPFPPEPPLNPDDIDENDEEEGQSNVSL